ncbi:hypothetical protein Lepto7375DRAFT_3468 [Leptolyngbya sp. PCC 7375]|nr:hypothetical protein Lepto7375DRAFT_3468 [Leptolyngbya sp. PCC 7375]
MLSRSIMKFPLWPYLQQPVFSSDHKTFFSPFKFWQQHKIQHLERCWEKEYRQHGKLN